MVHRNYRRTDIRVVPLLLFFCKLIPQFVYLPGQTCVALLQKAIQMPTRSRTDLSRMSAHDFMVVGLKSIYGSIGKPVPEIFAIESLSSSNKLHLLISEASMREKSWMNRNPNDIARRLEKHVMKDTGNITYNGVTKEKANGSRYYIFQVVYKSNPHHAEFLADQVRGIVTL